MRTKRHIHLMALAHAVVLSMFLLSCQPTGQQAPAPSAPPSESVYVIFEGPWAIVEDPKDANSVLALAPKTKEHRPLSVIPANSTLEAGVYDLQIPAHPSASAPTFDKGILRVPVDAQAVQRALDTRLERYAIRLPKPEAYVAETRFRSRVSEKYPPEVSTEQDYVTSISLRYSVTSRTGFSLTGTQDAGSAFKPWLLQLETPTVRFTIDPTEVRGSDACYAHARHAFHRVAALLALTLYVDFPDSPDDCHKKDPQLMRAEKAAALGDPVIPGLGYFNLDARSVETAGIAGEPFVLHLASARRMMPNWAAILFFHSESCQAPIIVGGGGGR